MMFRLSMMLAPLTAIGVLLTGVNMVDAGSYRWVDAEGRVHYSDMVPAEQVRMGYRVYDESGRELSVVEAARTEQKSSLRSSVKRRPQNRRAATASCWRRSPARKISNSCAMIVLPR